jgi:uncharacterized protein involved in outer membrane biogenesis
VLKWSGIVIAAFIVVLMIAALVLDANADALRGPIARAATARLGRPVHIDGRLELYLFSWSPHVIVHQLRIANPDWVTAAQLRGSPPAGGKASAAPPPAAPGDMARFGTLQLSVSIPALLKGEVLLPYVGIDDSELNVVRDERQRFNWSFAARQPGKPSNEPAKFPLLGSLHLGNGHLIVSDAIRKLHFNGTVSADQRPHGGAQSLAMNGDGDINGASFKLTASADPLITAESHKPYTVASNIEAGKTKVQSRITLNKPFDMGSVVADISASGDDFADLYYLSGLALPNTAPYAVAFHMQRNGSLLKVTDVKGTVGNSDIHGTISIETARERPLLSGDLATRSLDIKDLAPTMGTRVKAAPSSLSHEQAEPGQASGSATKPEESAEESTAKARAVTPKAAKTTTAHSGGSALELHGAKPKSAPTRTAEAKQADIEAAKGKTFLPDAKLDLRRIRAMDANVRYHAESIKADKLSIREIALDLKLDRGVLTLAPLSFLFPEGKLSSNIRIDGSRDIPEVEMDSRLTQVRLSEFKTRSGDEPIDGTLVGRINLRGRGKSMHEIGSTASGNVSFVIPHGDIRAAFAEALGINAARALGLLLSGSQEKTAIRCGVANFKVEGGVFAAQDIVFDTDKMLILGKGEVDLGPELLDLSLTGQPKHFTFFRIKSPVELSGTLSHPKVGLKPGNTPGEVALATALGVLATPLAAVLGFVDPGLAKDADCQGLITEAERQGAPPVGNSGPKEHGPIKNAQRSTKARSIT